MPEHSSNYGDLSVTRSMGTQCQNRKYYIYFNEISQSLVYMGYSIQYVYMTTTSNKAPCEARHEVGPPSEAPPKEPPGAPPEAPPGDSQRRYDIG